MNWLKNILRYTWINAWYTFALVVVLVATIFSGIRLLLPYASDYNIELSAEIAKQLGQPVSIGSLNAEWHGWMPSLILNDISFLDAESKKAIFKLGKIRVNLDLIESFFLRQPVFSNITLIGADLLVTRDEKGKISVGGLKGGAGGGGDANLNNTLGWILSQGWVSLEESNVSWEDHFGRNRTLQFSAVSLSLQNKGERHLLDASVTLPGEFGDSLDLHVDIQGDLLQAQGWQVSAFVEGRRINVSKLLDEQDVFKNPGVAVNAANFKIWGQWQGGMVQNLQGDINSRDVVLSPRQESGDIVDSLTFERVAGKFFWQREEKGGWSLEADEVLLAHVGQVPQPARVSLQYAEDGSLDLKAGLKYFELSDGAQLLDFFAAENESLQELVASIAPQGKLYNTQLQLQTGKMPRYHLYTQLQQVAISARGTLPAASNVEAQLWLDGEIGKSPGEQKMNGQVILDNAAVALDLPKLFREPIPVKELQGQLAWQLDGKRWRLSGRRLEAKNEDISIRGNLDIVRDDENSAPFLSLITDFREGDGSKLPRYLPAKIMGEKAVDWLDKGIVSGRVISGGAIFNGRVRDFPFDDGSGRFEVAFKVENAVLDYAKDWPQIHNIEADVQFLGRSISVQASKGSIFSNQIQRASVHIPNMKAKPMLMTINGEVSGATQDKLDYLTQSPQLSEAFGKHLQGMTAQGNSYLDLDLKLPIGLKNGTVVDGSVAIEDNSLSIGEMGQVLTDVTGKVNFSHESMQSDGIKARLLGQATNLTISTEKTLENRSIYIRGDGEYHAQDLASLYLPPIKESISGDGQWNVSLVIPLKLKTKASAIPTLRVVTDLRGVTVDLPVPLKKAPAEAQSFSVQIDFLPQASPVMRLDYADVLNGVFELGGKDRQQQGRGEFRLLAGPASLPDEPGFNLYANFDDFSLTDWLGVWNQKLAPAQEPGGAGSLFNFVGLKANTFSAFNQQYKNIQIQAKPEKHGWRAKVDSSELQGSLYVPLDLLASPIRADLSYWYIAGLGNGKGKGELDPRNIPALDIRVKDFRFKEQKLGNIKLLTKKEAGGMRIREAILNPESTTISLNGAWSMSATGQQSNISLNLLSKNVGNTLESLGYAGSIDDGEGVVEANLQWADSLLAADAANIEGDLHMSLKDGFLLDVNPGAGRLFGLLSLQMLPRRLLLDFSDVFKKGFGFDQIEGDFNITAGNAYTDNFYMQGPSARVDITGRVGLVAEDYDQLATVTPQVSDALPVLGALALTPQVGAAILFMQKILKVDLNRATQINYSITGKWKQPVIKKLIKTPAEPQSNAGSPQ